MRKPQKRLITVLAALVTPTLLLVAAPEAPAREITGCSGCGSKCPTSSSTCSDVGCPGYYPLCASQKGTDGCSSLEWYWECLAG